MSSYAPDALGDILWCASSDNLKTARLAVEELGFFYDIVYINPFAPLHSLEQQSVEQAFAQDLWSILADEAFPTARFVHNLFALYELSSHERSAIPHNTLASLPLNEAARSQIDLTREAYTLTEEQRVRIDEVVSLRYGTTDPDRTVRKGILQEALITSYGPGGADIDVEQFDQWLAVGIARVVPALGEYIALDLEGLAKSCSYPSSIGWRAIAGAPEIMTPYVQGAWGEFLSSLVQQGKYPHYDRKTMAQVLVMDVPFLTVVTEMVQSGDESRAKAGLEVCADLDERSAEAYPPLLEAIHQRLPTLGSWKYGGLAFPAIAALEGAGRNHSRSMSWLASAYKQVLQYDAAEFGLPSAQDGEGRLEGARQGFLGALVEALGYQTGFPERAVPLLSDALKQFEEYDPDWEYDHGPHRRVAQGLQRFGPGAAPALPKILEILKEFPRQEDFPFALLNVLWSMGDEAAPALSVVEQLVGGDEDETEDDEFYPKIGDNDPLCLLLRLRKLNGVIPDRA